MPQSNAISQANVAAVIGTLLDKGNFNENSPFLPQSISILAEANADFQTTLNTDPLEITNAKQAAQAYGYGSPMHQIARILFPPTSSGVSVPVYCYAQAEAASAAAKVITVTPSGSATASGTIYVRVAGRNIVDGGSYAVNIASGDTATIQCDKMRAAIAAVLGCPVTGSGTATFIATTKWKGLTANEANIVIDLNGYDVGVTYSVVNTTPGSGTPAVTASLNKFGNNWRTIVINSYGLVSATMLELEAFNGVPDANNPTGRFQGITTKPIYAFSGTILDDPTSITNNAARIAQVTICTCPAPLSLGFSFEAAANFAAAVVNIFQNTPNSSPLNQPLPDMPLPLEGNIPAMTSYTTRDSYVKKGCSTVDLINGRYVIQDFVTTYHPDGEFPPYYRYVRDMNVYNNLIFRIRLREVEVLWGKQLAGNSDIVTASNVITPNSWKTEVNDIIDDSVRDGLITDAAFSKASVETGISNTNPNRMDTVFKVKITGVAYIVATTLKAGFNFGTN